MKKQRLTNNIFRASIRTRLHFLFTGEIPGYWYNAQKDVMCAFMNYYLDKLKKCPDNDEEKARIKKIIDVFATHRFNKKMIQEFIVPNEKHFGEFNPGCGSGIAYYCYFPHSWLKHKENKKSF